MVVCSVILICGMVMMTTSTTVMIVVGQDTSSVQFVARNETILLAQRKHLAVKNQDLDSTNNHNLFIIP